MSAIESWSPEEIARVCHEANRALQHLGGDSAPSQPWDDETDDTRQSAISGVKAAMRGVTPQELHEEWARYKAAEGWCWGPAKDAEAKTHPCMVDYDELPEEQRAKDAVFNAIVQAMTGAPDYRALLGRTVRELADSGSPQQNALGAELARDGGIEP